MTGTERRTTPTDADLDLGHATSPSGLGATVLPNGALFAIEHDAGDHRTMVSQVLGSPLGGGLGRIVLRLADGAVIPIAGSGARGLVGCQDNRIVWQCEDDGVAYRTTLWLHPTQLLWLWRIDVTNGGEAPLRCDAILMQDLGLADRGFLTNNEAFACQYLDHHIAHHPDAGPVILTRQNLAQWNAHPWVAHGCLDGAAGFATDFRQVLGPDHRDRVGVDLPFGTDLPSKRLQGECAGAILQSAPQKIAPGGTASQTFFGVYQPDHPAASSDADLGVVEEAQRASEVFEPRDIPLQKIRRSVLEEAPPLAVGPLSDAEIAERYPDRFHEERDGAEMLSFFVPEGRQNRHVVLRDKERLVARRHGTILLSGTSWMPEDDALSLTAWMHGVFGAQLTIGNTSLHKLFSVSRDPYNIVRSNGLRILVDTGEGWRHLTVPSAFEMGLQDCRWIYRLGDRTITVSMTVGGDAAAQLRVVADSGPCRFLVTGHLVLGERELDGGGRIEIDGATKRATFRPAENRLWDERYPEAVFHLVTSTPDEIEAIGCDGLLFEDSRNPTGDVVAVRTRATNDFSLAIVGSMTSQDAAATLAERYASGIDDAAMVAGTKPIWDAVSPRLILDENQSDDTVEAMNTALPWLIHNARIHVAAPHGLEQYTGAAWGTRDVCQGPLELLLTLRQDTPAREILKTVFSQQDEVKGDWPQWFMLEPYSFIRDAGAHGDVIVWPLKAVCDYLEETGDLAFLDEKVGWRREGGGAASDAESTVEDHAARLIATVESRFLAGTHLIRYGNGDWNDSLQPVDPQKRDWMVSSWTVALLYRQLRRYAALMHKAGRLEAAKRCETMAAAMRDDFRKYLLRDGIVAGYAVFDADGKTPDLLLHPTDKTTGVSLSLISITEAVVAGLLTPDEVSAHLRLLNDRLSFPDGVRLMDRPVPYRGGVETVFRRAESAAYFGREIGLMYVHAHLRYAEMLAGLGDSTRLWNALAVVNPIAVTDEVANAALRQRNAYFSSSDAAFADRYEASREWERVRDGTIPVEGGWRIYSSGPGLFINMLIRHALGSRREFGEEITAPCLPPDLAGLNVDWTSSRR
ncbi:GH36-type glycosyl hydrolase domain-containing protein [Rhodobium gokarnense]|uniref:Cellobiose phosphorylase n=1 Tax=Rhodobium gokarnense TaxID=364296 RepID=A0ABT3H673_9HYPH|nr:cellobiose phosphorylase [Rhodobium gokarnense]MCW2305849.1 cellobiose phosphorylase [Rhodobium gokarnense]